CFSAPVASLWGWQRLTTPDGLHYWTRGQGRLLVFLHGFGLGVLPYLPFLHSLSESYCVVAPEYPGICFDGAINLPTNEEHAHRVLALIGRRRFTLVSNSYGSFAHSWLARHFPARIDHQVFIEPVCFYPHYGKLRSFIELRPQ